MGCRRDDVGQVVAADHLAEDDDADQHRQTTGRGDEQGLGGGTPTRGAFGVMPDEQERQDGRQFPEDVEQQHVVADHQTEHGAREGDHLGGEHAQAGLVVLEIARAVEQDQRADAQDEHAHDRRKRVEAQVEIHRQRRGPRDL